MIGVQPGSLREQRQEAKIKCVVWDLDNTLWEGVLLEGDDLVLRDNVATIIETLDRRGILQSIASKNDYQQAMATLSGFGLKDYFLFPQIGWDTKAVSIGLIAKSLNRGLDTVAFIDDQAFEREEVRYSLPDVRCLDAVMLDLLLEMPVMNPDIITADAK